MGKTKRCRTVILSASVAAVSAATACPAAASTAGNEATNVGAPRAVAREQAGPHRRAHEHTYKLLVDGFERLGNGVHATCVGASAVIPDTLLRPLSANTNNFFASQRAYEAEYSIHVNAETRLSASGPDASRVHNVCAMNETFGARGNGYAEPGVFTWRLPAPAGSVAEIVSHPAAEAEISTGGE